MIPFAPTATATPWRTVSATPLPMIGLNAVELRNADDPERPYLAPITALLVQERFETGPFGLGGRETRTVLGCLDPTTGEVVPIDDPVITSLGERLAIRWNVQRLTGWPIAEPPDGGGL